jgi:hypothetical protein
MESALKTDTELGQKLFGETQSIRYSWSRDIGSIFIWARVRKAPSPSLITIGIHRTGLTKADFSEIPRIWTGSSEFLIQI